MSDVREDLKAHARALHRAAKAEDPRALSRLRRHRELKGLPDAALLERLQRRHCLATVAHELGLSGWSHLTALLEGDSEDFGTLLHAPACYAHWNIWFAAYEEAREVRAEHGGFLLPYRHQFVVVDADYVRTLGLDPEAPEWAGIGRDWVQPGDPSARARLVEQVVQARMSAAAPS